MTSRSSGSRRSGDGPSTATRRRLHEPCPTSRLHRTAAVTVEVPAVNGPCPARGSDRQALVFATAGGAAAQPQARAPREQRRGERGARAIRIDAPPRDKRRDRPFLLDARAQGASGLIVSPLRRAENGREGIRRRALRQGRAARRRRAAEVGDGEVLVKVSAAQPARHDGPQRRVQAALEVPAPVRARPRRRRRGDQRRLGGARVPGRRRGLRSPRDLRIGTFAQYIAIDQDDVAPKPASLTLHEAVAVPLVSLAAWQAHVDGRPGAAARRSSSPTPVPAAWGRPPSSSPSTSAPRWRRPPGAPTPSWCAA